MFDEALLTQSASFQLGQWPFSTACISA